MVSDKHPMAVQKLAAGICGLPPFLAADDFRRKPFVPQPESPLAGRIILLGPGSLPILVYLSMSYANSFETLVKALSVGSLSRSPIALVPDVFFGTVCVYTQS